MVIGALLATFLAAGSSRAEPPLIDSQLTVPVHGEPSRSPKYIQNAIQAVGISGWGGATMATVRIETLAAKTFADRAFKATLQGLER